MANRYFGINRGQDEFAIVEKATTNSTDVELNLDLSKNVTKAELLQYLEMLQNYILKSQYPAQ